MFHCNKCTHLPAAAIARCFTKDASVAHLVGGSVAQSLCWPGMQTCSSSFVAMATSRMEEKSFLMCSCLCCDTLSWHSAFSCALASVVIRCPSNPLSHVLLPLLQFLMHSCLHCDSLHKQSAFSFTLVSVVVIRSVLIIHFLMHSCLCCESTTP